MDKHHTLWIKSACCFCTKARNKLIEEKLDHTIHIMDDKLEELDKLKELWGQKTVPLIVVQEGEEEKFIGGFTDLRDCLQVDDV